MLSILKQLLHKLCLNSCAALIIHSLAVDRQVEYLYRNHICRSLAECAD